MPLPNKKAQKQNPCASGRSPQGRPSKLAVPVAQLLGQSRNFFLEGLFLAPHLA